MRHRQENVRMTGSRVPLAAGLLLAPALAVAWDVDWALGLGAEHSDNIARTPENERSDTVLVPRAEFSLREQGTRVQLDAVGAAEYRYYMDGTFDDELRAELAARANFIVSPERFSWVVEDYLAQEPIDVFAPDRPDNTQRVNVFLTGPTARFRLAPATFLQAELRYIDTWAEETDDFDGERYAAAVRFSRDTSATSRWSLHGEAQDARFDEASLRARDFRRYDGYARWEREGGRLALAGDLGWTWIELDGRDDDTAPLLRADARWELTSVSALDLVVAAQYTDAAQSLITRTPASSLREPLPLTDSSRATVTADLYEERRIEAGWSRQGVRTWLRAGAFYRDDDYLNLPELDSRATGLAFDASWTLNPRHTLSAFAFLEDRDYTTIDRDDEDRTLGVRWRWHWLRRVWVGAELSHTDRDSSDPMQSFDETRALVTITLTRSGA